MTLIGLMSNSFPLHAEEDRLTVTIPVNIAYSADSLWSEQEIHRRLDFTNSVLADACRDFKIKVKLNQLLAIQDPKMQDISEWMTRKSVDQLNQLLSKFKKPIRPTIFYTRQAAAYEGAERGDVVAQAYVLGGPRVLAEHAMLPWNEFQFDVDDPLPFIQGNLEWERFDELKNLHGLPVPLTR